MFRILAAALAVLLGASATPAHFLFIVPQADGKTVRVVFSENLDPDADVALDKYAKFELTAGTSKIELKESKDHLSGDCSAKLSLFSGSLPYGVMAKGDAKPYLLRYHAKGIPAGFDWSKATLGEKAAIEIIPRREEGKLVLQVLTAGKALPYAPITVIAPDGSSKKIETGKDGSTTPFEAAGLYGAWTKTTVAVDGEYDGKKYAEVREYATVSVSFDPKAIPNIADAFTSFGAVTSDGYVYVYGGHAGKTHNYAQETTLGKFRRLKVADPAKGWEELGEGTHLQGTALGAHKGLVYRVGGMEPRNTKNEKSDLNSVATVQAYDPKTAKWTNLPDMPGARSSHEAVVIGDTLFVVAGWNMRGTDKSSEWCETACSLDLADPKATWKEFKQPFQRRALTAAAHDNKVYVVAGLTKDGGTALTSDVYEPKTGEWTKGPTLPDGKMNGFSPQAADVNGELFCSPADGKVYRMKGNEWIEAGSVKIPRWVHRAVPFGDELMVIAGATAEGSTGSCETVKVK